METGKKGDEAIHSIEQIKSDGHECLKLTDQAIFV